MKIFLDTADVDQIREAQSWGVIDGVTTNPSHVSKTGRKPRDLYPEICKLVQGPVSLETVSTSTEEIIAEGRELAAIAKNVVVKVPLTRPGLAAVKALSAQDIKTNVTVTFSPLQALLAAKCGATYISPFVGRLDAVGHDGMEVVRQIREIYDNYGYKTQLLAAAMRHPMHVLEAARAGADVSTMGMDVLKQLYDHPLTDAAIDIFMKDWAKVPQ
ncbi:MAG TPA: fructose-6-phosphate aldolase [Pirellulales bacterium]|jgi:transaldolase|nr:fructose-6-phosphate aldolase [Pirellulales bacterium]